jgi:hypothetical protein
MSLTIDSATYENDVPRSSDIMRYLGPSHTLSTNDFVDLSRTAPKPTTDYAGKGRARFKLTRNATDGSESLGDIIADLQISIPVGTQASEATALIDDLAAWLATTAADDLFVSHDIVQ